jgi:broad specificity phosphatase PhoE
MTATRIHLIRHGEVHNPDGILYGRLPNFGLSMRGQIMARMAAEDLLAQGRPVTSLRVSPLQRTRESASPVQELFGLEPMVDDRVIEPHNVFEGSTVSIENILRRPNTWWQLRNPLRPSWGEPFVSVQTRMLAALEDAWSTTESGDAVIVSHQMPIWITHLAIAGRPLFHNPKNRRCSLSSITSFEKVDGNFVEVDYREPAASLLGSSIDVGAV